MDSNKKTLKICEYCGAEFRAKKSTAKYCSNACRTKAYRKRNGIPAPDFSLLLKQKQDTFSQRQLSIMYNELNSLIIEQEVIEKKYQEAREKFDKALQTYENSKNNWSRENYHRRKNERDEIYRLYNNLIEKRHKIEENIREKEIKINRNELSSQNLIIKADEIKQLKYERFDLKGKWKRYFGTPYNNFSILLYSHKIVDGANLSVQFANYIQKFGSVIYFAVNKKPDPEFQELLKKNQVSGIDISFPVSKNEIEKIIVNGNYPIVFIDLSSDKTLNNSDIASIQRKYETKAIFLLLSYQNNISDRVNVLKEIFDSAYELKNKGNIKSLMKIY